MRKRKPWPVPRVMREEDLPAVLEMDAECMARPWSEGVWREELASAFGHYLVMEKKGEIIAQIGTKRVLDELHVMTVAVRPGHRRRGYARALIEAAVSVHPGVRYVHLEVRPGNTGARALYESMGFRIAGRRRNYYGDEDALLMTLDLGRCYPRLEVLEE